MLIEVLTWQLGSGNVDYFVECHQHSKDAEVNHLALFDVRVEKQWNTMNEKILSVNFP